MISLSVDKADKMSSPGGNLTETRRGVDQNPPEEENRTGIHQSEKGNTEIAQGYTRK